MDIEGLAADVLAAAADNVVARGLVIDACWLGDNEGIADDKVVVGWVVVKSPLW